MRHSERETVNDSALWILWPCIPRLLLQNVLQRQMQKGGAAVALSLTRLGSVVPPRASPGVFFCKLEAHECSTSSQHERGLTRMRFRFAAHAKTMFAENTH